MTKKSKAAYMISAVAEQYQIHPQTLRLYEREGLLKPSRSDGNTRLYTDQDLERLEVILKLTRDLGVNLAGVEIILNMRERMEEMQRQIEEFVTSLNTEINQLPADGRSAAGEFADPGDRDAAAEEGWDVAPRQVFQIAGDPPSCREATSRDLSPGPQLSPSRRRSAWGL
jgi:MerR family transcriptional regulator/heat shock protein HspR